MPRPSGHHYAARISLADGDAAAAALLLVLLVDSPVARASARCNRVAFVQKPQTFTLTVQQRLRYWRRYDVE